MPLCSLSTPHGFIFQSFFFLVKCSSAQASENIVAHYFLYFYPLTSFVLIMGSPTRVELPNVEQKII